MRKAKKITSNPIFAASLFLLGLCVGGIRDFGSFKFNSTIEFELFDVFSLVVTICLAIYVANVIEGENQMKQTRLEIWINRFKQIQDISTKLSEVLNTKEIYYTTIVHLLHNMRSKTSHIKKLAGEHQFTFQKQSEYKALINLEKQLRRLMTETPVTTSDKAEVTLKNNILSFSNNRKQEINSCISNIDNVLFCIMVGLTSTDEL